MSQIAMHAHHRHDAWIDETGAARYLAPAGRALFSLLFVFAGPSHFSRSMIEAAASQGLPLAPLLVPLSGIMALVGGLSVLLGYHTRIGAALLIAFLVPVTLVMHRFWGLGDDHMAQLQAAMFMKNLGLLGGACLLTYFGAGPLSLDARHTHDD